MLLKSSISIRLKMYFRILFILSSSLILASIFILSTKFSTTLPTPSSSTPPQPTALRHLAFGLLGSENAWHARKSYTQSWWRPNTTRGLLFLDAAPRGADLLPWSSASPPYRISLDLTDFLDRTKARAPVMVRMVNGIMEALGQLDDGELRWLVMGDDDSVFFVDNWVDVLAGYDHEIDLHGDISGLLSSHPNSPLLSLHHLDMVEPIFPTMDRYDSTRHLMKAAAADQSRMLQQTICHHRPTNWSFSVSWGYSAHIYEAIFTRTYLQKPIETFKPWTSGVSGPNYMLNTRPLPALNDSCKAPHVFFFERVQAEKGVKGILTTYSRAAVRGLPPCGGYAAESVSEISVWSPKAKRKERGRCECCDVVHVDGVKAELKFRECLRGEIIA